MKKKEESPHSSVSKKEARGPERPRKLKERDRDTAEIYRQIRTTRGKEGVHPVR